MFWHSTNLFTEFLSEMWHDKMELNSLLSMLHDKKKLLKIELSTLNSILCQPRLKSLPGLWR